MTIKQNAEKLYKRVNIFILSCVGKDGYRLTKAVIPDKYRESIDEIYFCTNTSSRFSVEISKNPKASIYFYTRKLILKGCMLKRKMEIVSDLLIKKKHWQEKFKNAYPEKLYTNTDFCLLKFTPKVGRFYSRYRVEDFVF